MQTINCYIPLKLRLNGEPGEDDWAALEEVLVAKYSRALRRSVAELTRSRLIQPEMLETVAEPFAPERGGPEGYWIPGYQEGRPTQIPLRSGKREDELKVRSEHAQKGPYPRDVAVLAAFLVRSGYVFRVSSLLPVEWRGMTDAELTTYLSERFTEDELQAQFIVASDVRTAIKANFRKINIIAALVIGLVWARDNIRKEEWGMAATKVGGMGIAAFALNRLLYARDLSAKALMARKVGEFGRWFNGAARTNYAVNVLLLWQVSQEFLMSGAGGPNIPFDIIQEIDIDDPETWTEPDSTLLDFGFNIWYRQKCTPAHPEACTPAPVYIAKVEGSKILGILKVLDIAPSDVPEIKQKLYRVEGDWGGYDILITHIPGRTIAARDNVLVIATGRRSGQLVSGRGHYRQLEVIPANEAAVALFGGREPQFVDEYLLYRLNFDNPLGAGSQGSAQPIIEKGTLPTASPPQVEGQHKREVQASPKKLTVTAIRQKHHQEREHTDWHEGSVNVHWSDDSTEFYHRIVEEIAHRFGINDAELWQPAHTPAYKLHSQLASNPNLHEGRRLRIRVGLSFDPNRFPAVSDVQLEPEPVVRRVRASVEKAPSQPARITEAAQPAVAAPEQTALPSRVPEETIPRSTAQPEAGKSPSHEPSPLQVPTVRGKREFEIELPMIALLPTGRLGPIKVALDDKMRVSFDGEISYGSPTSKITFFTKEGTDPSKLKRGADFEIAAKTALGTVKVKLTVEPDQISKLGIGLDFGKFSLEFSPNVDWTKPFSLSIKIPVRELDLELGEWTFKGKLEVAFGLNISPNEAWPGWATVLKPVGRAVAQAGRAVAGVVTGEVLIIVGGTLAGTALFTGFSAYVVGKAYREGNTRTLGIAFSNGYAEMLARLTSGEVVFDQRSPEFSKLLYFPWQSAVRALSQAYQAGGYDLSDVKHAGEAAALQDVMRYIVKVSPEAWHSLSQHHRDTYKTFDQRRHLYRNKLYEKVEKLYKEDDFIERLGINLEEIL